MSPVPPARLRPFQPVAFGRYTLLAPLAVGGMGEIFLARLEGPNGFEKLCVIKKILPALAAEPDFVARFVNEAKILVKLSHGSIAQVLEMGVHDEAPYIALEFVDGKDLRKIASRLRERGRPFPIPVALYVMTRVLDALGYAHRKRDEQDRELQLVHRDVSPQNVLVSYEGEVKVIDFGLAKSALSGAKTNPAVVLGKFLYMSPEQARHDRVDRRSDLYSAALCLYELIAGKNPLEDTSAGDLLFQVTHPDFRPLRHIAPHCPAPLSDVVMRALSADPGKRFQTAEELRARLMGVLLELDPDAAAERAATLMRELFAAEYQQERKRVAVSREPGSASPGERAAAGRRSTAAEIPAVRPSATPPPLPCARTEGPPPLPAADRVHADTQPGMRSPFATEPTRPSFPSPRFAETVPGVRSPFATAPTLPEITSPLLAPRSESPAPTREMPIDLPASARPTPAPQPAVPLAPAPSSVGPAPRSSEAARVAPTLPSVAGPVASGARAASSPPIATPVDVQPSVSVGTLLDASAGSIETLPTREVRRARPRRFGALSVAVAVSVLAVGGFFAHDFYAAGLFDSAIVRLSPRLRARLHLHPVDPSLQVPSAPVATPLEAIWRSAHGPPSHPPPTAPALHSPVPAAAVLPQRAPAPPIPPQPASTELPTPAPAAKAAETEEDLSLLQALPPAAEAQPSERKTASRSLTPVQREWARARAEFRRLEAERPCDSEGMGRVCTRYRALEASVESAENADQESLLERVRELRRLIQKKVGP